MKLSGVTTHDRSGLGDDLAESGGDEEVQHHQIRTERKRRDDEKAPALRAVVATRVAERPEPVERVVVRHRDEKGADSRDEVVEPDPVEQHRVDGQVDDVPGGADDDELAELLPVAPPAERATDPLRGALVGGGRGRLDHVGRR